MQAMDAACFHTLSLYTCNMCVQAWIYIHMQKYLCVEAWRERVCVQLTAKQRLPNLPTCLQEYRSMQKFMHIHLAVQHSSTFVFITACVCG